MNIFITLECKWRNIMKKAKKIEIKMANVGKEWTENKRRGSELKKQKQKNPVTGSKQQQQGQAEVTPLL